MEEISMTEAQLKARRENAKYSSGPRTSAGKKRSSLNAVRHGLTGQIVVQTPEDHQAFNKHCDGIRKDLDPEGALETNLAQAIAEDYWPLNRVRALENGIFALGQTEGPPEDSDDPNLDAALAPARTWMAHAHELHLLALYESRISRSVEKNTAQLRALQAERKPAATVEPPMKSTTVELAGRNQEPAGDLPPEIPDSSVRFFKGPDPESNQPDPALLPEPAAQPSRPQPSPPQPNPEDPPQRTTRTAGARQRAVTPWEPKPGEWVRSPIGPELIGRPVEMFGEFGDPADIGFDGPRRVIADAEVFQHPLSEYSHGDNLRHR
jgi:hypothetical protein